MHEFALCNVLILLMLAPLPGDSRTSLESIAPHYFRFKAAATEEPLLRANGAEAAVTPTTNADLTTTLLTIQDTPTASSGSMVSSASASASSASPKPTTPELPNKDETTAYPMQQEPEYVPEASSTIFPVVGSDTNRRRVVTYDQRQEGKYNVRADLENFMIVLIPPSAAASSSIFDLFRKSQGRNPASVNKKDKRRHPITESALKFDYPNSVKIGNVNHNGNYLRRPHTSPIVSGLALTYATDDSGAPTSATASSPLQRLSEFIEGRTPYHVDISANDDEHSHLRLPPERQVDVLPPPYPLAYQHLIKPFHLEAEPTLIQALPPPELTHTAAPVSGNYLETYNHLLNSGLQNSPMPLPLPLPLSMSAAEKSSTLGRSNAGYYRLSRALADHNDYENNELNGGGRPGMDSYYSFVRLFFPNMHTMYPPIDLPREMSMPFSKVLPETELDPVPQVQLLEDEQSKSFDPFAGGILLPPEDELELHVAGSHVKAGSSLSSGMERCAPGQRRDSYGLCREYDDSY